MTRNRQASAAAGDPLALRIRSIILEPSTWDEETYSVEAIICTDDAVFSTDLRTGRAVHEVWRQDGLDFDRHVPLIDNHNRSTVRNVVGSVRDFRIGEHRSTARLYVSRSEPEIALKIKEGHIKEVSAGGVPRETTTIPAGQERSVRGDLYRARSDCPLFVHTKFLVREISLTPKAADGSTQIRSVSDERKHPMKVRIRQFLVRLGLDKQSTDEEADTFLNALPVEAQAKARALGDDDYEEDEDEEDEDEDEEDDDEKKKEKKRAAKAKAEACRKEAEAAGRRFEQTRQSEIRRLGRGLPEEIVRKALDEGWTTERAAPEFLEAMRTRSESAGSLAIHSRSAEKDLTAEVLGAALSLRSLNQLSLGDTGYSQASNPVNLFGGYEPVGGVVRGDTDWVYRPSRGGEVRKAHVERLLNQADRYSGMCIMDMVRECCRIDGSNLTSWAPGEVIRAALSGGSFGAIFTTSFNALFMAGYLDATDTTAGWTTESDMPNFLPGERATVGKMGQLTLDGTGKPAEHMTYGDWNEPIRLHRFTGQYVIDEKDLINDRFGALQTWSPQELGLTARQMRPNLVYSTLMGDGVVGTSRGPTLNQDGQPVFCAAHGNFAAAASSSLYNASNGEVYSTPLQTAISQISEQRIAGRPLNLRPRFMLMAPKLRWGAAILFQSVERVIASASGGTFNPLRDLGIEPRDDARLNVTGCWNPLSGATVAGRDYHWFLVARPGEEGAKTMEVVYLQGTGRAPQIRSFVLGGPGTPGRWGIGWDVKHDIGCAVIDYRGMYYGEGAS